MSDREFPSGPWTGFYTYQDAPTRHRTDLILTFARGRITGEGADQVGPFVIEGTYNAASKDCGWTKSYVAAHDVEYSGFREGKGIWGTWTIRSVHGGFHIWPRDEEEERDARELEEARPNELAVAPKAGRKVA